MSPRAKRAYGCFSLALKFLMAVFLAFGTSFGFCGHFGGLEVFVINNHGINICRTMNDGRPCLVIRGAHCTAFGNPGVLSKIKRGQFPVKSRDGEFLCVYVMAADHDKRNRVLRGAISKWHLRAFAAIWLLGTIICRPLVIVLMEIAWGFCLNQLWWHIRAWKKCCALSPFTRRAGGIKKAGNWCFLSYH